MGPATTAEATKAAARVVALKAVGRAKECPAEAAAPEGSQLALPAGQLAVAGSVAAQAAMAAAEAAMAEAKAEAEAAAESC